MNEEQKKQCKYCNGTGKVKAMDSFLGNWVPCNTKNDCELDHPTSTPVEGVEEIKKEIIDRIDFLLDHWTENDKKPPYNYGGWREEIADDLINIFNKYAYASGRQSVIEIAEAWIEELKLSEAEYKGYPGDNFITIGRLDDLLGKLKG